MCVLCKCLRTEASAKGQREKQPWLVRQSLLAFTLHHPALPSIHFKFILFLFREDFISFYNQTHVSKTLCRPPPRTNGKITFNISRPVWVNLCVMPTQNSTLGYFFLNLTANVSKHSNSISMKQSIEVCYASIEDPLEEGMATHSSILAWKTPRTEEPGGLHIIGLQRVGHD